MDDFIRVWASWSPEARENALYVHNAELVDRIDANMRMLWRNEIKVRENNQGALQNPVDPFDYSRYPLTSTMQFDSVVMGDQKVYKVVRWPKEIMMDPGTVPAAIRSITGGRQGSKRMNPARWAQALLLPPPKTWGHFEQQLANLIEQLVLQVHSPLLGASGRTGNSSTMPGQSRAVSHSAQHAEIEVEDDLLGAERAHDGNIESGGEDADAATATELTGRAAKRARQRERRRMFKAAARAVANGDVSAAAISASTDITSTSASPSITSGPSGGAVRPNPAVTAGPPSLVPHPDPLLQNMRCAPPPQLGVARGAHSPVGMVLSRPQGAGGGRRTDSPVWQPPGIWEPARIDLSEAADLVSLDADDLADAEAPQLQDVSADENDEFSVAGAEAAAGATRACDSAGSGNLAESERAADAVSASGRIAEVAPKGDVSHLPAKLPDAREPAKVVPEVAQAGQLTEEGEASLKASEPVKVMEDEELNPWSGRPVSGPGSMVFGVGRGKPLGAEEPEGRWGDSFGSMGMGRGRALTPPPGLMMRKNPRAPGGLAQTWMPGPSIPEEDGDDPEKQNMPEDVQTHPTHGDIDGWLHNMQFADHLVSALSSRERSSSWSQASFANTPSMAWSKTPSPPSTPINRQMLMGRAGVPPGALGSFALPEPWQGAMPGAVAPAAVGQSLGTAAASMAGPIPLYVTVPIAMAHSCPHCGRAFAMPPDESAEGDSRVDVRGGIGGFKEAPSG